ncbi:DUF7147 family protein [Kurthia zopfii]|uniref:DUF7147 family protein n=1 Tax=Kurthia zopfii TaxID=1650 RepID=UPI000F71CCC7|nr:methylthioribose kinase [Kurthia zopfii]VEI04806.1 Uncharacterised protein [Kurthia zopfii]
MIQKFIELGQGYGDIFELCEIMTTNKHRIHHTFAFVSDIDGKKVASIAVALKPVGESKFMPIYICREGIPYDKENQSKRFLIFENTVKELDELLITLEVKNSSVYVDEQLYYHYLTGVLRLYHYIPAMY